MIMNAGNKRYITNFTDRILKSGNALTLCHIATKVVNGFLHLFNSLCADVFNLNNTVV